MHPAARSLCDSWASCTYMHSFVKQKIAQQNLAKICTRDCRKILYIWKKNVTVITELYQIFVWDILPMLYAHCMYIFLHGSHYCCECSLSISIWKCWSNNDKRTSVKRFSYNKTLSLVTFNSVAAACTSFATDSLCLSGKNCVSTAVNSCAGKAPKPFIRSSAVFSASAKRLIICRWLWYSSSSACKHSHNFTRWNYIYETHTQTGEQRLAYQMLLSQVYMFLS